MPAVEAIDVVKTYGDRNVVDRVSFSVEQARYWGSSAPTAPARPPPSA